MDALGGLATAVEAVGFAVSLIGFFVVIWRVRDETRRAAGLQITYAGMAAMCLGGSLFVLSRPAAVLPGPLNFVAAGMFFVVFLRLAIAAILLRVSNRA